MSQTHAEGDGCGLFSIIRCSHCLIKDTVINQINTGNYSFHKKLHEQSISNGVLNY